MMKRSLVRYLSLLSVLLVLAGCQNSSEQKETTTVEDVSEASSMVESTTNVEAETIEVSIEILVDGEAIKPAESFEVEAGSKLLAVMKDHYDIEEKDGFVQSIEGHQQDEAANKWWLFDVNGEMAEVGAAELSLNEGDTITWKLATLE